MTYATLASVANPATGWSTGFILPSGPLMLPTVYIPIKSIPTQYGFIVLGLTITGVWIFPLVLMVNYSTEYAMPILDPTTLLKTQLDKLKKVLTDQLTNLKESVLKFYLENKEKEVKTKEIEVSVISAKVKTHKLSRPSNTSKNIVETTKWKEKLSELQVPETQAKLEKYKLEQQYEVVYNAYTMGSKIKTSSVLDAPLLSIQQSETLIEKGFEEFDDILSKMDKIVAPLPTTLQPNTANFGITLKNPKPVINIAKDLEDNINEGILNPIIEKFKPSNESFMSGSGTFNSKAYNTALDVAKILPSPLSTIQKDPFPAYENLKITNFQWMAFLYKDFVTAGAKTYGLPGQLPLPI